MQTFFSYFAVALAAFALIFSLSSLWFVLRNNTKSKGLRRMRYVNARLADLESVVDTQGVTIKRLNAKLARRDGPQGHVHEVPDPATNPEAYKNYMRRKLNMNAGSTK